VPGWKADRAPGTDVGPSGPQKAEDRQCPYAVNGYEPARLGARNTWKDTTLCPLKSRLQNLEDLRFDREGEELKPKGFGEAYSLLMESLAPTYVILTTSLCALAAGNANSKNGCHGFEKFILYDLGK
jgi:hypothetical protein